MATTRTITTKRPTPLSTHSLAAFLTWKQFDVLLTLEVEGIATASMLAGWIDEIQQYDEHHGGAFYYGTNYSSLYSCLTTLLRRRLVERFDNTRTGYIEWGISERGKQALDGLK
jgi:hypothetical protein